MADLMHVLPETEGTFSSQVRSLQPSRADEDPFPTRQTRREAGAQSHGSGIGPDSRAAERRDTDSPGHGGLRTMGDSLWLRVRAVLRAASDSSSHWLRPRSSSD